MKRMLAGLFFCFILLYNGCAGAAAERDVSAPVRADARPD